MSRAAIIFSELTMSTGGFQRGADSARGAIRALSAEFTALGALSARGQLTALGMAVGMAVQKFSEGEQATIRLRSALSATGNEVDANYARFVQFGEGIASVTTLSVDQIKTLQTSALNLGVSADHINDVVKAGIGLGERFYHGNYAEGVRSAALATQGQFFHLQRLIPALRETHSLTAALAVINKAAVSGFKEAKDQTQTFAGSMALLNRSIGELEKEVGSAFAPTIVKAAQYLRGIVDSLRGMTPEQREQILMWTKFAIAVGGATATLGPFGAALALLGSAYANLTGQGDTFIERFNDGLEKSEGKFGDFVKWLEETWSRGWEGMVYTYFRAHDTIFGGDAQKDFLAWVQYNEDAQAQIAKDRDAAAAKRKADQAKGGNDEINLEKEKNARMRGEAHAQFMSIEHVYKSMQLAILKDASATPAVGAGPGGKPLGAAGVAGPAGIAAAAVAQANKAAAAGKLDINSPELRGTVLAENAAIQRQRALKREEAALLATQKRLDVDGFDARDPDRRKRIERDLAMNADRQKNAEIDRVSAIHNRHQLLGEDPAAEAAKFNEKRLAKAKADKAKAEQSLKNLNELYERDAPGSEIDRENTRKQLENQRDRAQSVIDYGGRDISAEGRAKPLGRDSLGDRLATARDMLRQARARGDNSQIRNFEQKVRVLEAEFNDPRIPKKLRETMQTPEDVQNKQFGANVAALGQAAKDLGKSGLDVATALQKARLVGVIKD